MIGPLRHAQSYFLDKKVMIAFPPKVLKLLIFHPHDFISCEICQSIWPHCGHITQAITDHALPCCARLLNNLEVHCKICKLCNFQHYPHSWRGKFLIPAPSTRRTKKVGMMVNRTHISVPDDARQKCLKMPTKCYVFKNMHFNLQC